MAAYILKRLLLIIPTLLGVLLLTFVVIQFVPGGPVEQMMSQLQGRDGGGEGARASSGDYRGRQGLSPKQVDEIILRCAEVVRQWPTIAQSLRIPDREQQRMAGAFKLAD